MEPRSFAQDFTMRSKNSGSQSTSCDGAGVSVGIILDSFDESETFDRSGNVDDIDTDIEAGSFPEDTRILSDHNGGTDEGRAMAQIVHSIAPGAAILFETASGVPAIFAQHIEDLASAGAKVIVNDIGYPDELDYRNGVISGAIDDVAAKWVTYITDAGNNGSSGYEGTYVPGRSVSFDNAVYAAQDVICGNGDTADTLLSISGKAGQSVRMQLEWDQPGVSAGSFGGALGDLDKFITDSDGNVKVL